MKKLLLTLAMVALIATPAMAFDLGGYYGDVKFIINSWDEGTLYPVPGAPGVMANTPALADAVPGAINPTAFDPFTPHVGGQAPGGPVYPAGVAGEDSWAIFRIDSITTPGGSMLWSSGGSEFLTGYFHHEVDHYVRYVGPDALGNPVFDIRGIGGRIEIFLDSVDDFNAAGGPGVRKGPGFYLSGNPYGYPGAAADDGSEGTLFLSLDLNPAVIAGDAFTTFSSIFSPSGTTQGNAYLDITGGAYMGLFDTNTIFDPNGNIHDFFLTFTANPDRTWVVTNSGHALGNTIPEPASLALLGLGLAGLARLRRRKA